MESGTDSDLRPFLSRIEITHFRNFENLAIDLQPVTVLVGENRSGKSNLLEALRLVLDPSLADSNRQLKPEDFWDGLEEPFGGNVIEVKVYIQGLSGEDAKAVLADCIVETKPLTALLTYRFQPRRTTKKGKGKLGASDYEFVVFGGSDEKNRVGSEVRKWICIVVLPALRDAESDLNNWRKSPLRPLLERVQPNIPEDRLREVHESLDEATSELLEEPAIKAISADVNDRIADLVGVVHGVETELAFSGSETVSLMRSLRLFVREGQRRPLAESSLGTANLVFLSLLLQNLEHKLADKELVTTILALEEPEAHLHPHLQRLLFRHFLVKQQATIVTTHSPNIASVAPIPSLVLLRNVDNRSQCFTAENSGLDANEIADLQRYMDVTRAEFLFARGVIFVEGSAEQFLLPVFAERWLRKEKIARSLDELGISICSVAGTDFVPYRKLLGPSGFGIPNVVITDGDPRLADGVEVWDGLTRGIDALYDVAMVKKAEKYVSDSKQAQARATLASGGVFVGEQTLEIDLLPSCASQLVEAYAHFRTSKSFGKAVEECGEGNSEAAKLILQRIERIGKGRFAQRLAEGVRKAAPPQYILDAIKSIVEQVQRDA